MKMSNYLTLIPDDDLVEIRVFNMEMTCKKLVQVNAIVSSEC
jgi:hypothetical protein